MPGNNSCSKDLTVALGFALKNLKEGFGVLLTPHFPSREQNDCVFTIDGRVGKSWLHSSPPYTKQKRTRVGITWKRKTLMERVNDYIV